MVIKAAPKKMMTANTHPILHTAKGIDRMPEPITVLIIVEIVNPKSF